MQRVADADALPSALRFEGRNVLDKSEVSDSGTFGWVVGREGAKVQGGGRIASKYSNRNVTDAHPHGDGSR